MHNAICRFLVFALFIAVSGISFADHINGYFVDDSGTRLQLRQQGLSVVGQAVLANGQTVTLNGQSDSNDYVRGQTQGAFNGTFEMLFEHGRPSQVHIILYSGNFQVAVDETVFVQTTAPRRSDNSPGGKKTGTVFGSDDGDQTQTRSTEHAEHTEHTEHTEHAEHTEHTEHAEHTEQTQQSQQTEQNDTNQGISSLPDVD